MKILAFGDLMGKTNIVARLLEISLNQFDLLIYTGDTPDPSVFKALREARVSQGIDRDIDIEKELIKDTIPYKALKKATGEVIAICSLLDKIPIPFYGVLGNADLQYYSQFVKWPFTSLHKKIKKVGDYNLIGYNGRPLYQFEKQNTNENAFSEKNVEKDLKRLFKTVDPQKTILVTHPPPYKILDQVEEKMLQYAINTYGNKAKNGHIGSTGIRKAVEKFQPLLHIFGHIHENQGVVRNDTTFVNTGSTGENQDVCQITIHDSNMKVSFIPLKPSPVF